MNNAEELKKSFTLPTSFKGFGKKINTIICFDENGSSAALNYVKQQIDLHEEVDDSRRYFTLTGCLFTKENYQNSKYLINTLKKQYWKDDYTRIVFHSRDIRRKLGYYHFQSDAKYVSFIESLSSTLSMVECTVISITFDLK